MARGTLLTVAAAVVVAGGVAAYLLWPGDGPVETVETAETSGAEETAAEGSATTEIAEEATPEEEAEETAAAEPEAAPAESEAASTEPEAEPAESGTASAEPEAAAAETSASTAPETVPEAAEDVAEAPTDTQVDTAAETPTASPAEPDATAEAAPAVPPATPPASEEEDVASAAPEPEPPATVPPAAAAADQGGEVGDAVAEAADEPRAEEAADTGLAAAPEAPAESEAPPEIASADPGPAPQPDAAAEAEPPRDAVEPADAAPAVADAPSAAEPEETGEPVRPGFDAVRVGDTRTLVLAGQAEPGAEVTVTDNGEVLGTVEADESGTFVFRPSEPLEPGGHDIGLESGSSAGDASPVLSNETVTIFVPEPDTDVAGREGTAAEGEAMIVMTERGGPGPSRVIRAPTADAPATEPAEAPIEPAAGAPEEAEAAEGPPEPPTEAPTEPPAETQVAAAEPAAEEEVLPPAAAAPPVLPPAGPPAAAGAEARAEAPAGPPPSGDVVSVDVIDYDDLGNLAVTGRAEPEAEVRLYLDNELQGRALADSAGTYTVETDQPVDPGTYRLRVDRVDPAGSVVARAETPFRRDTVIVPSGHRSMVVQPGDNLWRIARNTYGAGVRYTVIYQANTTQIRDPDLIYPGQIFLLPGPPTSVPAGTSL